MLRAEQARLFAVPQREHHRPLRRLRQFCERIDDFEHARDAAGVVVGAVVNVTGRPVAVRRIAVADVIVVGRDEHILLLQLGIAPFEVA